MPVHGRTEVVTIDSAALAGNPLGDPARRRGHVWLPPSYDTAKRRRYPVLYLLASHAGDSYFELSILKDVPVAFRTLRKHGGIDGFLRHFDAAPTKRSELFTTIMMLALGAAYAPDAGAPHGFQLPFDLETGEIVEA